MASLLVDVSALDQDQVQFTLEDIRRFNPQRHEMEQLSGIFHLDVENARIVGYKDVRDDEFWVRGHIPGRPLLPGVLMLEAAAQLCSFLFKKKLADAAGKFLGFAGLENVKFRGTVVPGDRLVIVAVGTELRSRRAVFQTQGLVRDRLVFEATVIGMPI